MREILRDAHTDLWCLSEALADNLRRLAPEPDQADALADAGVR